MYDDDLRLAHELADLADSIALPRFTAEGLRSSRKPDGSFVTEADTATERALRDLLAERRPRDGFLGEETGESDETGAPGTARRRWIIDPIDGTANYLRGVPNWGALIALEVDGVPVLGVVSAPAMGARWWAMTGAGAWKRSTASGGAGAAGEPRRLRVSGVDELGDASLSFQGIDTWEAAGRREQLLDLASRVWRDRAYGDLWSYMLLAEGAVDIVCEFDVKPYDIAAILPIVREAGGSCTDAAGEESHTSGELLATNGRLHAAALAAIAPQA